MGDLGTKWHYKGHFRTKHPAVLQNRRRAGERPNPADRLASSSVDGPMPSVSADLQEATWPGRFGSVGARSARTSWW